MRATNGGRRSLRALPGTNRPEVQLWLKLRLSMEAHPRNTARQYSRKAISHSRGHRKLIRSIKATKT